MKDFFKTLSMKLEDKVPQGFIPKVLGFFAKHPELSCILLLGVCCYFFLFLGLDFYPLMDVDETRYAVMSRDLFNTIDWNSLMLNFEPFLEKPPLYFWLVGASVTILGKFNEFSVRLPIALLATFITYFTYYIGKKAISRKFGMLSALILLSSMFFLILSHVAIIDMVLTVFMTSTIYCSLMTHLCEDKYKKYWWWYFYMFAGIGFLAKGILAIAIPAVVIFAYNLITKTLKDIFKPIHMLPGLVIFLLIAVPWHIIMYMQYGNEFIKQYFLMHHFARFINSETIGRERPFYYFIPIFLLGFLPWTFIFLAFIAESFKTIKNKIEAAQGNLFTKILSLANVQTNVEKTVLFSALYFIIVFVVFSSSSTKLPTYILPAFPAAALLTGYFWWSSDENDNNKKAISITTQLFAALFIVAGLSATIAYWVLPYDLQTQLGAFKSIIICGIFLLSILLLLRLKTQKAISVFSGYIFTMLFIIIVGVSYVFNVVYQGGENEIVMYSNIAQNHSAKLVNFDFAVKPSALIEYRRKVNFITDTDFDKLDETLKDKTQTTLVIVKNKNLRDDEYRNKIEKRLELLKEGKKYSLYAQDVKGEFSTVLP